MLGVLGKILGFGKVVAEPVVGYFRDKMKMKSLERQNKIEAKREIQKARLENIRQGKINEAEWNLASIRNSSWKDEWLVIILSIPLVGVFIPGMVDYMLAGFEALKQTPEWYRYSVGLMIASSFGYQKAIDFRNKKRYE